MTLSLIQPKRPTAPGWRLATWWTRPHQLAELGYPVEAWEHPESGLFVLSAVEVEHDPGAPDLGPEYHLSMSLRGHRCSTADAVFALAAFGLTDATEDNHVPSGRVRNFWRAVADKFSGHVCHCQDEEPAMREDKGDYVWRGVTR